MTEDIKPELKQCSRCHSTCTLEFYEKNRKGEWFKSCNNCRNNKKEYRENNKDKLKLYYEHNKESILESRKEYRDTNRDTLREYARTYSQEYRKTHSEQIEAYQKQWFDKNYERYTTEIEELKHLHFEGDDNKIDESILIHALIQKLNQSKN